MKSFAEFYQKYPNLAFVKTKIDVQEPSQLTDEVLILDEDTPPLEKGFSIIVPLYEKAYPHVFKEGTAMEVGLYAIDLCEQNDWEMNIGMFRYIFQKLEESLSAA